MYRGFALLDDALAPLGGLVRAETKLRADMSKHQEIINTFEQRVRSLDAELKSLTARYHEAVRLVKKDPRIAVNSLVR